MAAQNSKPSTTQGAVSVSNDLTVRKLVFAGVFAALTYIVFMFLSIQFLTCCPSKV